MRKILWPVITACLLLIICGISFAKEPIRTLDATVERVSDGDTIIAFDEHGTKLRIRLYGLDAPETAKYDLFGGLKKPGQPLGEDAEKALKTKVVGKKITVVVIDVDRYKRPVCVLRLGNRDINEEMLSEGWAEAYREHLHAPYRGGYLRAETQARKEKRGIWGLSAYERPSDFRRRMRISGGA